MAPSRLELRRQPVTFTLVMRKLMVNLKRHLTALAASVLLPSLLCAEAAPAALLDRLATASPAEAPRIAREIEAHWAKSGSAAMDLLLRRGRDAMEASEYVLAIEHFTALTDHAPAFAEGFHARAGP